MFGGDGVLHPDHGDQILRLNRIEGQVRGIKRMIEERRYCMEILHQLNSVTAALNQVKRNILKRHLESCVSQALGFGSPEEREEKIQEIMRFIDSIIK